MLYVIYDTNTDIDEFVTDDKASALTRAGELIDGNEMHYQVHTYDCTRAEYDDCIIADDYLIDSNSLRSFVKVYAEESPLTPADAERLMNLSDQEKQYVILHIKDEILLSELSRRIKEYREFAEKIGMANDELRIFV